MTEHLLTQLETDLPVKYRLNVYGEMRISPLLSVTTWDGYDIRGDWLITFENGTTSAYKLPANAEYIQMTPAKPDPLTDPLPELEETQQHDMQQELQDEPKTVRRPSPEGDDV